MYEFEIPTGKIVIDHTKCEACQTKACVKACSLYNGSIYRIHQGRPFLAISHQDAKRGRCIECLSCEYECQLRGNKALSINLPLKPTHQE